MGVSLGFLKNQKNLPEQVNESSLCAFDEFKLFYESAEKVTDRRLEANRWNYSINTAVLGIIGLLISWSFTNITFLLGAIVGANVLSIMAILFCSLWILQIQDYKRLNNAKFKVLNRMASKVKFSDSGNDKRVSFDPFSKEWEEMKETKAVREIFNTNIIALNSSGIEYIIPQMFRILFILTFIGSLILLVTNWDVATASTFQIPPPTPIPTPTVIPTVTP